MCQFILHICICCTNVQADDMDLVIIVTQYSGTSESLWVCFGGRRSPAVACWASDQWVASSNPLRGKFRH